MLWDLNPRDWFPAVPLVIIKNINSFIWHYVDAIHILNGLVQDINGSKIIALYQTISLISES